MTIIKFFPSFLPLCLIFPFGEPRATQLDIWDTEGIEQNVQIHQSLDALSEDCYDSPSENSVLQISEVLEVAAVEGKRSFVCELKMYIEDKNRILEEEQEFMFNYINTMSEENASQNLSEADHLKMIELMIKYRLLGYSKEGKEYYVPATRWTPPSKIIEETRQIAENYFQTEGSAPAKCFFIAENKRKQAPLTSEICKKEILQRVQVIPSPLILAQAALESGWGKSDLAKDFNNVLGLQVKFNQPDTMPEYDNCQPAKKDRSRCLLKFENFGGSVYEYFSRFNSSHLENYRKYRQNRLTVYQEKNSSCEQSLALVPYIDFYAENPRYTKEVQEMIEYICSFPDCKDKKNNRRMADSK